METGFVITSLFEIAIAAFIIFGLFNENRFADTEKRVFSAIKKKISALFSSHNVSPDHI